MMRSVLSTLLFLLVALPLSAQRSAAPATRVELVSSGSHEAVFEVIGLDITAGPDGLFTTSLPSRQRAGGEGRAMLEFMVALPPGASEPRVETEILASRRLTSLPGGGDGRASTGEITTLRGFTLAPVRWSPLLAGGDGLAVATHARFRVTWKSGGSAAKGGESWRETREIEEFLATTIVNFRTASGWRLPAPRARLASADVGIGEAIVLEVAADGLQSISGADLASASGGATRSLPISSLRLVTRGQEVPFRVVDGGGDGMIDDADRLEFIGRRNPSSDGFYYDLTTDTNAYLLTWKGGGGATLTSASATATVEQAGYDSTLHFEEERFYHAGIIRGYYEWDIRTLYNTDLVENERNLWMGSIYPTSGVADFSCAPLLEPNGTFRMSVRLVGASDTTHYFAIRVNGVPSFEGMLQGFADSIVSFDIPAYYLRNGRNTLSLDPKRPPFVDSASQWTFADHLYLDYIEIKGRWLPSAFGARSAFRHEGGGGRRLAIAGFTQEPTSVTSPTAIGSPDSLERGFLIRLTSRQFEPGYRHFPGFVAETANDMFESNGEGVYVLEFDGATGRLLREGRFHTWFAPDQAKQIAPFVRAVKPGNILVAGLSITAGADTLPADAAAAFAELGSRIGERRDLWVASWLFAVRKGTNGTAVERIASLGQNNRGLSLDAFIPDAQNGTSLRAHVSSEEPAGTEVLIGVTSTPQARYHATDSLLSAANRADLLIITHPGFRAEAERLAQHRRDNDSLVVRVIDVETVYDEFNGGVKSSDAIRRFLAYADSFWTRPAPIYVLLMGDASVDPQRRIERSQNVDYVPSHGIPASDYMLTVAPGDESQRWRQMIGRLPVATPEEARWVVDKLIDYDAAPPAQWNKHVLLMQGGSNQTELQAHRKADQTLAINHVLSFAFLGDTSLVHRTATDLSFPDVIDGPWARSEMDRGALWVTFSGHGASTVYDLDFGYPGELDNAGRLFILSTHSCRTGDFADIQARARNEEFVVYPKVGAVAAIGGTSYSFTAQDVEFRESMLSRITEEHERSLGLIFTQGKYVGVFSEFGIGWNFSLDGWRRRHMLTIHSLLGDPSMKVAARATPEISFTDVNVENEAGGEPAPGDSVAIVSGVIWNNGRILLTGDSAVAFTVSLADGDAILGDTTLTMPLVTRSWPFTVRLPLKAEPAEYRLRLLADPTQLLSETYRTDNDTTIALRVRGNQLLPLEPLPFGRVAGYDDLRIRLLNPAIGGGARIVVDTSDRFDPASSFGSDEVGTVSVDELTTTWRFSIPQALRGARTFWWRAVATAGDTSGSLRYPVEASFSVAPGDTSDYLLRTPAQRGRGIIEGLANADDGLGAGEITQTLEVLSVGQRNVATKRVYARIGRLDLIPGNLDGVNVVVLPAEGLEPVARGAFAFYRQVQLGFDDIDRFLEMIDSVKPGERVILAAAGPSFFWGDSAAAVIERFHRLGASSLIDTIDSEHDSYVLLGGIDVPQSWRAEAWNGPRAGIPGLPTYPATVRVEVRSAAGAGSMTTTQIGPAARWERLTAEGVGLDRLAATLVGVGRDGVRDSLARFTSLVDPVSLSSVDAARYPRLELRLDFPSDTLVRLRELRLAYAPSPELAFVPSAVRLDRDSVLQGEEGMLRGRVVNLSHRTAAVDARVDLSELRSPPREIAASTIARLAPLDSTDVSFPISTASLRDEILLAIGVNRADVPGELYRQNNVEERRLRIGRDSAAPELAVYADGVQLMPGDYVAPSTRIEVRFFDNSQLRLDSMTIRRLILDNEIIDVTSPGASFVRVDDGEHRASFFYQPPQELADGRHELKVFATDASGNGDTTDFIDFNVEREFRLRSVVNWPNPFADRTTFTFLVSGMKAPTSGEIALFTVAGRKIRSIPLDPATLRIGFNRVEWDGRDSDGDILANGVYLYRLKVGDGERSSETIEKVVVMR